ncbi:MAG: hypothetical protein HYX82_04110 [Chloroflexi bacterium]|nr:hypothetical protein [Chloroflexota bacterium]
METKTKVATRGSEWGVMWLKACPKCKGDMFIDHDAYGYFKECLQCGYLVDINIDEEASIRPELVEKAS